MKAADDLLIFLLKAVQHAIGENSFTDNLSEQVEQQLRAEFGGQEIYISKTMAEKRRIAVLQEFNGRNRQEVCDKHDISKAHFYRILKSG